MRLSVPIEGGDPIEFECADNWVSRWVSTAILEGRTYRILPFIRDVQVIVDVGANCGATSVHLARAYPDAQVHALEPAGGPRALLERNVARFPNVAVHPVGLHRQDGEFMLYGGIQDSITGSIFQRPINSTESEVVQLRDAGTWAAEQRIERIDVLKIDNEGCEAFVLESLEHLLPTVQVLYLEYDGREQRRTCFRLRDATHDLFFGALMGLDQGECIFVRRDIAASEEATNLNLAGLRLTPGDS